MKNPWKCSPLIYGSAKHQDLQILRFLTFFKCLFTHFVKVFFCMASRSSGERGISWRRRRRRKRRKMGGRWKPRKLLTDVNAARPLNHSGSRHFQTDPASYKREAAQSQPRSSQDRNSLKSNIFAFHESVTQEIDSNFNFSLRGGGHSISRRSWYHLLTESSPGVWSTKRNWVVVRDRLHILHKCLTNLGLVGCT